MEFNFVNFGIGKNINLTGMKHDYDNKKLNRKNREQNIYGTFYGDIEDLLNQNDEEKANLEKNKNVKNSVDYKNYFGGVNFVKGTKTASETYQPKENKIEINPTKNDNKEEDEDEEEEINEEYLEDYTKDKTSKLTNKKEEKQLEKELSKKYGKGFQMLKKIGFKVGSGLGVNEQGITDPIKIKKRKKKIGISHEDKKVKNKLDKDEEEEELDTIYQKKDNYFLGKKKKLKDKHKEEGKKEIDEFEQFTTNWSKIKHIIQSNRDKEIDIEEILPVNLLNKISIDISSYNELINRIPKNNQMTISELIKIICNTDTSKCTKKNELVETDSEIIKENLVTLIKKAKLKSISHLSSLKTVEDSTIYLNFEAENIQDEILKINKKVKNKEKFLLELTEIEKQINTETKFQYLSFINSFIKLYLNNCEEYTEYKKLTFFCMNKIINRMKFQFTLEDYFTSKKIILPILEAMKKIINLTTKTLDNSNYAFTQDEYSHIFARKEPDDNSDIEINEKLFGYFLNEIVINDLVNYIINDWNVRDYDKLIEIFKIYNDLLPSFMKNYIYESALIPRLKEYITEQWSPDSDYKDRSHLYIHLWILPWLEVIKLEKLNSLVKIIQEKIEANILKWDINNTDWIEVLNPWRRLWDEKYFEELINKYVIPKLNYVVSKMTVNPKDQNLTPVKILFKWGGGLISEENIVKILKTHFFSKWLNTLKVWLEQGEMTEQKFNEIQKWYEGWKKYFEKNNLITNEEIKSEFKHGLMLIMKVANS